MAKCPNCGSTAQSKVLITDYKENGWDIEVVRTYICGCGITYTGTSHYHCDDCDEVIEMVSKKKIQERLYGRG